MTRIRSTVAVLSQLLVLGSCGSEPSAPPPPPPPPAVVSVAVTPASGTVEVGKTIQLAAVPKDGGGNTLDRPVSWSSSSESAATVSSSGLVTGLAPGVVTISAVSQSVAGTASVTVILPPVATVTITPSTMRLVVRESGPLTATLKDAAGNPISGRTVVWAATPLAVATVSGTGLVTGLLPGTATVTATSEGKSATASITVVAGAPSKLVLTTSAARASRGRAFGTQPVVSIRDQSGNLISDDNTTVVTMTVGTGTTTVGGASVGSVAGVAAFKTAGVNGTTGSAYALTFTAAGLIAATQSIVLEPISFETGTRIVGPEAPAGLYRSLNGQTTSCYWERLSGFGGSLAEIIANDLGHGPRIVAIAATDKGFSSSRCGAWTEITGPSTSSPTADFIEGVYTVGSDLAPGTWRSSGSGASCYWARLRGFSGTLDDIEANNLGAEPAIVAIAPTDIGFETSRCGAWKKIN